MLAVVGIAVLGLAGPLDQLKELRGTWTGTSEGASGKGSVTRTYEPIYGDRYVRCETVVKFPSKNGQPGEVHRDTGYFSFDQGAKALALREFHIEGFVNTYSQQPTTNKSLLFETREIENIGKGWRARTEISFPTTTSIKEVFSLAEPGKEYEVYSTTLLKRQPAK